MVQVLDSGMAQECYIAVFWTVQTGVRVTLLWCVLASNFNCATKWWGATAIVESSLQCRTGVKHLSAVYSNV